METKNLQFLLSLSDDIATIKDRKKLMNKIFNKLLDFYDLKLGGFAFIDKNKESIKIIIERVNPKIEFVDQKEAWGDVIYLDSIPFEIPIDNNRILYIKSEYFYSMKRLLNNIPTLEEVLNNLSIDNLLLIPTQTSGELLGYLILSVNEKYDGEIDKDYLIRIGNVFGSALSNIMAVESIKRREKEKEKVIEILSSLVTIKDKEDFNLLLAEQINKFVKVDYIALYGKGVGSSKSITFYCIKDINNHFKSSEIIRGEALEIQSLISQRNFNKVRDYSEVTKDEYNNICSNFEHFRILQNEHKVSSIVVLQSGNKSNGELNIILGRKDSTTEMLESNLDFIFTKTKDSLFTFDEINFALDLIPQIGLLLSNVNSFEEIKILTRKLEQEKNYLLEEINLTHNFSEIIGSSSAIKLTLDKIEQVAPIDATVLIQGETGTGKELVARAVHNLSARKQNSFITVNCAALPVQLIESELFGHEKGSFTGAIEKRIGKFEVADGGTIFLDEIGELPLEIQAKLLRVLQEKEFERLGGKSTIYSNVRIIAATNRDLVKEVDQGKFRADLYFRLNVFPILVPPLRERTEDIPLLVKHFIEKYSKRIGKEIESIKKNNLNLLLQYEWPGNIRELEHLIERAIIVSKNSILNFEDLLDINSAKSSNKIIPLEDYEREYIVNVLKMANGKVTGKGSASQLLSINGKTLGSKMKKLGINAKDFKIS